MLLGGPAELWRAAVIARTLGAAAARVSRSRAETGSSRIATPRAQARRRPPTRRRRARHRADLRPARRQAREVIVEVDVPPGCRRSRSSACRTRRCASRASASGPRSSNSGFEFPQQRITANLAPADLRKAGPGFDLAIAAALLAAADQLPADGARPPSPSRASWPSTARCGRLPARSRWPRRPALPALRALVVAAANAPEAARGRRRAGSSRSPGSTSWALWSPDEPARRPTPRRRQRCPGDRPRPRRPARPAGAATGARDRRRGRPQPADHGPPGAGKSMAARRLPPPS